MKPHIKILKPNPWIVGKWICTSFGWGGAGDTLKECYSNWMICRLSQKVGSVYEGE